MNQIILSNGQILEQGCRVRVPRKIIFDIPNKIINQLGLILDDNDWSPDSEVLIWPLKNNLSYFFFNKITLLGKTNIC